MRALRWIRRLVFVGAAGLSIAAGLAVQFTDAMWSDVRAASTADLLLVLVLIAAPMATMGASHLVGGRQARSWDPRHSRSTIPVSPG